MAGLSGSAEKGTEAKAPAVMERGSARFIRTHMKNGRRICIKCPRGQKAGLKYRLHRLAAVLTAQSFLRVLPPLAAEQKNLLEIARLRAFKAAGLPVAEILAVQNSFSVLTDTGKNIAEILAELRGRDARLHDGLLIRCAQLLGQVHAAELCVGRPDLGNMFLAQNGVGFSGFDDYPEEFMPLAAAQLRDIWQALHMLAAAALDKDEVLARAFMAWRRQAGLEVLENLRAAARFFRLALKPYKLFAAIVPARKQADRLRVLRFLAANLGI